MSLPETQKVIQGNENGEPIFVEVPLPKPSQNQIVVKIAYAPLNPIEMAALNGFAGGDRKNIGAEGSGVIAAVGENLKIPFKVGDRVHVIGPGTLAPYFVTNSENCFLIQQDDLSLEDAASHYINPATVLVMGDLAEKGNHKAAIHTAGASALGRMMIKYFKSKGIKLINVVRRDEYIEELKKEGADYVLNMKAPDFEAKLKELAEKEKATIAFDAVSGEFTGKILGCQPPGSICYVSGGIEGTQLNKINTLDLLQGKLIGGLFLFTYVAGLTEDQRQKFMKEVHSLLPTVFKTEILKVFPLEQISDAIALYKETTSKGKILLKPN